MWLEAIDHIQVTSAPEAAAAMQFFYKLVLGLPELSKPETLQGNGGAWYALGDIQIHISTEKDVRNDASRRHICFQVQNLDAFREHLKTHQIEIIPAPQPIAGCDRFFLRDPGGNRIEIAKFT